VIVREATGPFAQRGAVRIGGARVSER